jgi:uncharacterized alpha-E superfamily protein
VSRLIAVTFNRWQDVHPGVDPAVLQCVDVLLRGLVDLTGREPRSDADPQRQLHVVIGSDEKPGSLAHDVRRVRELANASRDQLSTDTWGVFSAVDGLMAPFAESSSAPRDLVTAMRGLREALLAFAGLAAESMVRDVGWHFMDAGRRTERAIQVGRLLQACLVTTQSPAVDRLVEESTLIAAESIITHRRRYLAQSGIEAVLELLLTDRDNPRSVAFQLDRLATDLRRTSGGAGEDSLDQLLLSLSAQLRAVDCAALAKVDATGRRSDLDGLLGRLIRDLQAFALAIEQKHFAHLGTVQQLVPIGALEPMESVGP